MDKVDQAVDHHDHDPTDLHPRTIFGHATEDGFEEEEIAAILPLQFAAMSPQCALSRMPRDVEL